VSDDDREGAYLEEATRTQNGWLPIVLMRNDANVPLGDVPWMGIRLIKPYSVSEMRNAILHAGAPIRLTGLPGREGDAV
jgi:hypothetical protein